MKRKVEASDTDSGIQINISSSEPEEVTRIKTDKKWYMDVVQDHENKNEHGQHHGTHHEVHGSAHKRHHE